MSESADCDGVPILCARCLVELTPGKGDFYAVRIDAVADPSPPQIEDVRTVQQTRAEIDRLIDQLGNYSEQELLDQVRRRVTLHMCARCFGEWIEDPAAARLPGSG